MTLQDTFTRVVVVLRETFSKHFFKQKSNRIILTKIPFFCRLTCYLIKFYKNQESEYITVNIDKMRITLTYLIHAEQIVVCMNENLCHIYYIHLKLSVLCINEALTPIVD